MQRLAAVLACALAVGLPRLAAAALPDTCCATERSERSCAPGCADRGGAREDGRSGNEDACPRDCALRACCAPPQSEPAPPSPAPLVEDANGAAPPAPTPAPRHRPPADVFHPPR